MDNLEDGLKSLKSVSDKLDTILNKMDNIENNLKPLISIPDKLETMSEEISTIKIVINYFKKIFSL